jgi:hypothetical protein
MRSRDCGQRRRWAGPAAGGIAAGPSPSATSLADLLECDLDRIAITRMPSGLPFPKSAGQFVASAPPGGSVRPVIPPLADTGAPGFEAIGWVMVAGPAGMPKSVTAERHVSERAVASQPAPVRRQVSRHSRHPARDDRGACPVVQGRGSCSGGDDEHDGGSHLPGFPKLLDRADIESRPHDTDHRSHVGEGAHGAGRSGALQPACTDGRADTVCGARARHSGARRRHTGVGPLPADAALDTR